MIDLLTNLSLKLDILHIFHFYIPKDSLKQKKLHQKYIKMVSFEYDDIKDISIWQGVGSVALFNNHIPYF